MSANAARMLGGDFVGGAILCPGPGHSARDRSLKVWLDPERVHSFAGDDWRDCLDHVRERIGLEPFAPGKQEPHRKRQERDRTPSVDRLDEEARTRARAASDLLKAKGILRESIAPTPTSTVGLYLIARGIDPPWPDCIREHPRLYHRDALGRVSHHPAMVCPIRDIHTDEIIGVHRTWLAPGGHKADVDHPKKVKKVLGRILGGAIKLSPDEDVTLGLGVCEGIENGLSILAENFAPVWALGFSGNLAAFPVLPGIEALTIFGDNDDHKSGTGEKAAREGAGRWRSARREVTVYIPKAAGCDWNDELGHR